MSLVQWDDNDGQCSVRSDILMTEGRPRRGEMSLDRV